MKYRDVYRGSNHCMLAPASGSGDIVFFSISHDVPIFDEAMKSAADVEMFILGDRAAWVPPVATLWAEQGRRTVSVRIGEIAAIRLRSGPQGRGSDRPTTPQQRPPFPLVGDAQAAVTL